MKMLENDHIRLRAPEPEDLDILYKWENNTEWWQYGSSIVPFSRFALKQYLIQSKQDIYQDKQLRLMVELKSTHATIGSIDLYDFDPFHLRAGVGILVDENYHRQGYASQILELLEAYCFGFLRLNQLYAVVPVQNTRSINLFKKSGYILSGTLQKWLSSGDFYEDATLFQKINHKTYG
ncbi:MAG TPA: GNAT family N-acetyltransferase [Porphyromonadaceae bacterium]|jgi:diamine N-acetyltransferase|nr:GNAT family N-acetyltransferase [Porphyromonadaceae bacterium]HBL34345.1 GNAT family N-acetyltransferase [Porphyromonadaceae bacterium]HBX20191.1 GNAT family N-acetyltransferase [Porphyromonadaceae bacterium]HCM19984.1 GNAT family N-acetyltransferase [Porphyromonadaceae bacterium]